MESTKLNYEVLHPATLLAAPTGPLRVTSSEKSAAPIRLSIVLPTFNEARNIERMILGVNGILEKLQISYEIIVVDDDSTDGTWLRALALCATLPRVRAMRRTDERGLATAVVRGWQASAGEVLGVMDADLQHPAETLPQLWAQIESGADLAVASRGVPGGGVSDWRLRRRAISWSAHAIGLLLLPDILGKVTDPLSGYFLVRRDAVAEIGMNPKGYKILIEILGRSRVQRIAEVGYVFRERSEDASKVSGRVCRDYLLHLATLRLATLLQFWRQLWRRGKVSDTDTSGRKEASK
jgi:dolichol-phosphate mannosyltransferase